MYCKRFIIFLTLLQTCSFSSFLLSSSAPPKPTFLGTDRPAKVSNPSATFVPAEDLSTPPRTCLAPPLASSLPARGPELRQEPETAYLESPFAKQTRAFNHCLLRSCRSVCNYLESPFVKQTRAFNHAIVPKLLQIYLPLFCRRPLPTTTRTDIRNPLSRPAPLLLDFAPPLTISFRSW